MNNKVVYKHIRLDNDQVFYIGMGNQNRAYQITGRNQYWDHVYINYGHRVEILAKNLSEEDALDLEALLIESYGRLIEGGTLVNLVKDSREPKQKLPWRGHEYWETPKEVWELKVGTKEHYVKYMEFQRSRRNPPELDSIKYTDKHEYQNRKKKYNNDIVSNLPNRKVTMNELSKKSSYSSERTFLNSLSVDQKSIIKAHNKKYNKR
jgi:hypothetical protein